MRLSWKINLVLILVFCVALGLQAASAVVRETDLFEREMQRDHEVMGSSLRHAVDDAWRIGGTDAAQRLVPHLDAEDQGVRVRWIELGVGSGQPADLPDAATTALASGVVTSVIAAGPAGPAGPARPLGAGLPARPLAAGLPARPLAAGFRYTYVPLDAPHAALEFRESLAEQRRYVASSGIRLAGWLVVLVIATSAAVGWLVRVLVGRPVDQLIAHAGRVGD
ncbi:MAG: hypothetical protein ABMB14_38320, partial [Myxococcota bacterium]